MPITYKGVPNRERWLAPEDKFKSKGIIELGNQTFTIPPYKVELELVIDGIAEEVVQEYTEEITETPEEIIIPKKRKQKPKDVVEEPEEVESVPEEEKEEDNALFRSNELGRTEEPSERWNLD